MRVRLWTASVLLLVIVVLVAGATGCGGGSSARQANINGIPSATLPSTLPDPIIVRGIATTAQGQRYVIQSGDTISSIAAQFGITAEDLMAANGITDPSSLVAGVELVIPGTQTGNAAAPTATAPPPEEPTATPETTQPTEAPPGGQQTYVVQPGDIPETIAAQFGITAEQLMAANGITDSASLQVGQQLIIPTPEPTQ